IIAIDILLWIQLHLQVYDVIEINIQFKWQEYSDLKMVPILHDVRLRNHRATNCRQTVDNILKAYCEMGVCNTCYYCWTVVRDTLE
ncbi:hypothetical protein L9F63_001916, partial [Diploptera punctata]